MECIGPIAQLPGLLGNYFYYTPSPQSSHCGMQRCQPFPATGLAEVCMSRSRSILQALRVEPERNLGTTARRGGQMTVEKRVCRLAHAL